MTNAAFTTNDPFIDEQGIPKLAVIKDIYGFKNFDELGRAIGEEEAGKIKQAQAPTVRHNPKFQDLYMIASMLFAHFGEMNKCKEWIQAGRKEWLGKPPIFFIRAGRAGFVKDFLEQAINPEGHPYGG